MNPKEKRSYLQYTIKAYKVVVDDNCVDDKIDIIGLESGFVCDKFVSREVLIELLKLYREEKIDASAIDKVLITPQEYIGDDMVSLLVKQILHYMSCGTYGVQTVELENKTLTFDMLHVVSRDELVKLIKNDIYSNKPLAKEKLKSIIELIIYYDINVDNDKVQNNEIKMHLYNEGLYELTNGDDVVRFLIFATTGNTMLIKSEQVINEIMIGVDSLDTKAVDYLFYKYQRELAQVFNRHKKIILLFKNKDTTTQINKISKLSKKLHKPIIPAINKTFIAKALKGDIDNVDGVLSSIEVVDKLKFLYALDVKKAELDNSFYMIRNGKCYYKPNLKDDENKLRVNGLYSMVLASLLKDLSYLKGKTVNYPSNVDYGLPISEKQAVGHIPYGTRVKPNYMLSIGVYWENKGGARDIDLSMVDTKGNRVGWGSFSSYSANRPFRFSGDITNAPNGAMEFFTQQHEVDDEYLYISNLYSGAYNSNGKSSKYKIVIGENNDIDKTYISNVYLEVDTEFSKRGELIGAFKNGEFILWKAGMSTDRISSDKNKAFIPYVLAPRTTLSDLLLMVGAKFTKGEEQEWDYDLSLENVTFNKLQDILFNK